LFFKSKKLENIRTNNIKDDTDFSEGSRVKGFSLAVG